MPFQKVVYSQSYNNKNNNPPDRWIPYPRRSIGLIGNIFIATKTFLDDKFDSKLTKSDFFKPSMIKNIEKALEIKIGLVVDLSNSRRYYDPSFFDSINISHTKLACVGVDGPPESDKVTTFINIVKKFLFKTPDQKIRIKLHHLVVHCTHGFNRTGYMIIAYLVNDQGWDLKDALTHFSQNRPPGIYKPDYIKSIITRYSDPKEQIIFPTPRLPDWCGGSEKSKKETANKTQPATAFELDIPTKFPLDDPLITVVTGETYSEIRKEICSFFNTNNSFPGCQPVSLSKGNLNLIKNEPYMVSWKADGSRFLMYIRDETLTYMIDREFKIFHIPHLTFPSIDSKPLKTTILDGEFVFERDKDIMRPRFLIFDLMVLSGNVINKAFPERLELVDKKIIAPRDNAFLTGKVNRQKEAFSIRSKKFFDKSQTRDLFEKYMKNITHETDGLVFHPVKDLYHTGTCHRVLKWKPDHLNTVDFYLNIHLIKLQGCLDEYEGHLYVLHHPICFAKIKIQPEHKKLNRKIIECAFDKNKQRWKFLRVREDKCTPNAYDTAKSLNYLNKDVCETILNPITIEDIYQNVYSNLQPSTKKMKKTNSEDAPENSV